MATKLLKSAGGAVSGLVFMGTMALLPMAAQAAIWSDNSIGYRYGHDYREPVNSENITKQIISFTSASGYKYGSNFFTVDMLSSDNTDPASCSTGSPTCNSGGAHEVYAVYRTTFSGSSVFGTPLKFGIIRDIGLQTGFDFNAKDDQFASRVAKKMIGPKFSFDVPGFFDVAAEFYAERNHNWYATQYGCTGATNPDCGNVQFKNTYTIESAWGIPFKAGLPMKFQGFCNYIGVKGPDGVGQGTRPETLLEAAVMVDVGSLAGQKETVYLGLGYQYWHNKFGNDSSRDSTGGSTAHVPQLELEWHL